VGWFFAAGLAAYVGMSSYVIANEVRAPLAAVAIGLPPTGAAKANGSAVLLGIRRATDPRTVANTREVALARDAYRAEPLSSTALSIMISAISPGATRNALLVEASKLTRRNALLNEEQIKLAAARGDDEAFFRWLSRSVLTNHDLRAGYVGAMAEATAKAGAVAALTPVIGPEPSWSDFYWQQVVRRPTSLKNAARLRLAIAKKPWRQTEIKEIDEKLGLALVGRFQFDAAYNLYLGLAKGRESRNANLLVNGDFARQPQLAPFDWQVATSGTLGATIDSGEKRLVVSAIGGARGIAARQLVRLTPGIYQLSWSFSSSTPIEASSISARVSCAEPAAKSVAPTPVELAVGNKSAPVVIADGACRWHWLAIDVVVPDDGAGFDAAFNNISLTRGGGRTSNTLLQDSGRRAR
jgi:hypothetical protein